MKRAALYVRVSTEEQKKHGLSVDSQITALNDFCKANNYKVVDLYNDAGISARKRYTKRPALLQLLEDVKQNKIDIILFTKLDRWFRSVADYYEVQAVLDENNVPWKAIWEDYETETSSGVFKVNIMLSVAQSEADRTSERIKSVFDYKREQGEYVGSAPYGYMRKNGQLVKNQEHEYFVNLLFKTYMRTKSTAETLRILSSEGCNISRSGLHRMLSETKYCGYVGSYKFEPYITQEQFEEIRVIRNSKKYVKKSSREYLFSGMCRCGLCNTRMRSLTKDDKSKTYCSYYCTGYYSSTKHDEAVYVSELKLEKYILKNLENLLCKYNQNVETSSKDYDEKKIKEQKSKLEAKLKRVGIRFEDGDISQDEYREKRKAILDEIASLSLNKPTSKKSLPDNWKDIYESLDKKHKREFFGSFIDEIVLYPRDTKEPEICFLS